MQTPTSDANNPPTPLWIFDPAALRDGDVVLEVGQSKASPWIARFDGGPFTHALIWVGGSDFVEAVPGGVRNIAYVRVIISDPTRWLLLRHGDAGVARRAALAARGLISKRYDFRGALSSKSSLHRAATPEALFCSQLVAEAYLEAGVEVVPGVAPNKVRPRSLLDSTVFAQLPPPLVTISPSDQPGMQDFLDRDSAFEDSIADRGSRIEREVFTRAKPLLKEILDPQNPGVRFPPGNLSELTDLLKSISPAAARQLEDNVLESMLCTGYFHQLEGHVEGVAAWLVAQGHLLRDETLSSDARKTICALLSDARDSYASTTKRHSDNADVCRRVLVAHAHPLWQRLAEMYGSNAQTFVTLTRLADEALSL